MPDQKSTLGGLHRNPELAAARGNHEALDALVRLYHDQVYRYGLRVCRDGFDADDAVQQAFIKLSGRPDVAAHPGALSWMMTTIRNTCRRMLRPLRRDRQGLSSAGPSTELAEIPSTQLDPQQALEREQLVGAVRGCIAALDQSSREVIILRDLQGLSGDETCRILGIENATMKSRLLRARARLRQAMQLRAVGE